MCILLVDDEALILEIMAETLAEAGYDVLTACDGPCALALFDQHACRISALVSDLHLPHGLTGIDIVRAVRSRRPDLPVILATGRPDVLANGIAVDRVVLLTKPFRPSEMVTALGRLLPPHTRHTRRPRSPDDRHGRPRSPDDRHGRWSG